MEFGHGQGRDTPFVGSRPESAGDAQHHPESIGAEALGSGLQFRHRLGVQTGQLLIQGDQPVVSRTMPGYRTEQARLMPQLGTNGGQQLNSIGHTKLVLCHGLGGQGPSQTTDSGELHIGHARLIPLGQAVEHGPSQPTALG